MKDLLSKINKAREENIPIIICGAANMSGLDAALVEHNLTRENVLIITPEEAKTFSAMHIRPEAHTKKEVFDQLANDLVNTAICKPLLDANMEMRYADKKLSRGDDYKHRKRNGRRSKW